MVLSWRKEVLGWMSGGSSLLWEWWGAGTGCPERLWMPHPWRCSRPGWIGPWQPGLVLNGEIDGPACGRGIGASWTLKSLPTQTILWFCDIGITGSYNKDRRGENSDVKSLTRVWRKITSGAVYNEVGITQACPTLSPALLALRPAPPAAEPSWQLCPSSSLAQPWDIGGMQCSANK